MHQKQIKMKNTKIINSPHKRDSTKIIPPELFDSELLFFPKKANKI